MAKNSNNRLFGFLRSKNFETGTVQRARVHDAIWVGGIRIELQRKNIKNVHLRVYPPDGKVRVSVPFSLPRDAIEKIIRRKMGWIKEQQTSSTRINSPARYVSGERHQFAGVGYPLYVFNTSGRPSVTMTQQKTLEMNVPASSSVEQREKLLDAWYRKQLKEIADPIFENWQLLMGVSPSEWRIKKMKTRWGSCNVVDSRIWLSLELAKKPSYCIEYVIVHELAHLIERGHGKRFVEVMDRHLPAWRKIKRELNSREI